MIFSWCPCVASTVLGAIHFHHLFSTSRTVILLGLLHSEWREEGRKQTFVYFSHIAQTRINYFLTISSTSNREMIGTISAEMLKHVLESFAATARITLHVHNIHGENNHHKVLSLPLILFLLWRQFETTLLSLIFWCRTMSDCCALLLCRWRALSKRSESPWDKPFQKMTLLVCRARRGCSLNDVAAFLPAL